MAEPTSDSQSFLAMRSAVAGSESGGHAVGSASTPCPKVRRVYRIHPAIGIARVGNSDEFFIGPERLDYKRPTEFFELKPKLPIPSKQPKVRKVSKLKPKKNTLYKEAPIIDPTTKKPAHRNIRRQAARFRIFEYERCEATGVITTRELRMKDFEYITWAVEVANVKSTFSEFIGPNWSGSDRKGVELKPSAVKINSKKDGINKAKSFDVDKSEAPNIMTLGHAYMDKDGFLVFLGGYGFADGDVSKIDGFANNDGWQDDVSDGSVTASFRLKGAKEDVKAEDIIGSWVVTGPPDFAPELMNVVSVYDTMLDVAIRELEPMDEFQEFIFDKHYITAHVGLIDKKFRPYFEHHVFRLFQSTKDTATVFLAAAAHDMHPKINDLSTNTSLDEQQSWRQIVFDTLRAPHGAPKDPGPDAATGKMQYAGTMPMLYGDEDADYHNVRYALPVEIYKALKAWLNKDDATDDVDFNDTAARNFSEIPLSSEISPWNLDRAALEHCVGGPFYPGIEVSWLIRKEKLYMEPFRFKKIGETNSISGHSRGNKVITIAPGFLSAQMAQPWQTDFHDCAKESQDPNDMKWRIGWWPAQRPDDVVVRSNAPVSSTAFVDETFDGPDWNSSGSTSLARTFDGTHRLRIEVRCIEPSAPPDPSEKCSLRIKGKTAAGLTREQPRPGRPPFEAEHGVPVLVSYYFTEVEYVEVTTPASWAKTRITIGYSPEEMLQWKRGVADRTEMPAKWSRLGFVVGGIETERDLTLT